MKIFSITKELAPSGIKKMFSVKSEYVEKYIIGVDYTQLLIKRPWISINEEFYNLIYSNFSHKLIIWFDEMYNTTVDTERLNTFDICVYVYEKLPPGVELSLKMCFG